MLGGDDKSLYVAFMGTKHMRDLLSDANFLQEAVWKAKDPDKQQQVINNYPLLFLAQQSNRLVQTVTVSLLLQICGAAAYISVL